MVRNFRWVEPGRVALSGYPETVAEVDWLTEQGVRVVVSLHPIPAEAQARLRERGVEWRPFLVEDLREGAPAGLPTLLAGINAAAGPVLIHCQGGGGRSASVYALSLVAAGLPAAEAIRRAGGIEKEGQRAFVHGYAAAVER